MDHFFVLLQLLELGIYYIELRDVSTKSIGDNDLTVAVSEKFLVIV